MLLLGYAPLLGIIRYMGMHQAFRSVLRCLVVVVDLYLKSFYIHSLQLFTSIHCNAVVVGWSGLDCILQTGNLIEMIFLAFLDLDEVLCS